MIKICNACGKEFEASRGNTKYCSENCSELMQKLKKRERAKSLRTAKKISEEKPKTDWEYVVRVCNEQHISYGEAVRRGIV